MDKSPVQIVPLPGARADAPASFVVYPAPQPASKIGKMGAFALGVATGIVGVAAATVIMDEYEKEKDNAV